MWSKELLEKIGKHQDYGKQILEYANTHLGVGLRYTSVNKLAVNIETCKQTEIREQKERKLDKSNNINPFYKKSEKMIRKYQKENDEIQRLKENEKAGESQKTNSESSKVTFEKLVQDKELEFRKGKNGKYICKSLPYVIEAYTKLADDLTWQLINDNLVKETDGKSYNKKYIQNMLSIYGCGRKTKSRKKKK